MAERYFTVDSETEASNPGGLRVSRWRWLLRHPRWPMALGLVLVVVSSAAVKIHWGWWLPVMLVLLGNWYYWRRVYEHFAFGCLNPGQVVSVSPLKIAVLTDLSFGQGYYPALKIVEVKSSGRWTVPIVIGARVATIAVYSRSTEEDVRHWDDFDPHPVDPLVSDLDDARRLLERIPVEEFDQLGMALEGMSSLGIGLHRIEVESTDW